MRALFVGLVACAAACGGSSRACPAALCGAVRFFAYFSVTDGSASSVADAQFFEGTVQLAATRVAAIPSGPAAGPCDCYEVDLREARAVVSVRASGRRATDVGVDVGDPQGATSPDGCPVCAGPPPRSGMRVDVALQRD
jgi:hypothetical protein